MTTTVALASTPALSPPTEPATTTSPSKAAATTAAVVDTATDAAFKDADSIIAIYQGKDNPLAINRVLHAIATPDTCLLDLRHIVVQHRLTVVVQILVPSASPHLAKIYRSLHAVASALSLDLTFDIPASSSSSTSSSSAAPAADAKATIAPPSNSDDEAEAGVNSNDDDGNDTENENDNHSEPTSDTSPNTLATASNAATPAIDSLLLPPVSATNYVLTLLSPTPITPSFLARLSVELSGHALTAAAVTQLSASSLRCLELALSAERALAPRDVAAVRTALFALGRTAGVDVALQAESVLRRSKRLVVFDMDSTLIQQEVIDELARRAGVFEQVRAITHRAMCGELDFRQSLAERVALLAGADASIFDEVIAGLVYTAGAKTLCRTLKRLGYKLAVISGGFTRVTQHVRHELGLDYDYANTLEESADGKFTGRTIGPIVSAQRKADLLSTIAQLERITLDQVIAIGDGANDLPMLGRAGLGIAFNAKPAVQEVASFRINQPSLTNVLYLLGFSEQDQIELSGEKK